VFATAVCGLKEDTVATGVGAGVGASVLKLQVWLPAIVAVVLTQFGSNLLQFRHPAVHT
jgi:hypothetical protein